MNNDEYEDDEEEEAVRRRGQKKIKRKETKTAEAAKIKTIDCFFYAASLNDDKGNWEEKRKTN